MIFILMLWKHLILIEIYPFYISSYVSTSVLSQSHSTVLSSMYICAVVKSDWLLISLLNGNIDNQMESQGQPTKIMNENGRSSV